MWRADADPRRCRHQVTFVAGEIQPDAVGILPQEGREHLLEVAERARCEAVALRGLDVQLMEGRKVCGGAEGDVDTQLGGLLDVAPPQLIHPREYVVGGPSGQRDLEDELWLTSREPVVGANEAQPCVASNCRMRAPSSSMLSGGTSARLSMVSSAIAALMVAADQRRTRTGGPIRIANAPLDLTWSAIASSWAVEVGRCPVEERAFGEIGRDSA